MAFRYPRSARLTRSPEFRRVREEGASYPGRHVLLGVLRGAEEGPPRFGIVAGRKVGGAVERNRARRRLREIIRTHRALLVPGCWVVTVLRRGAAEADTQSLRREWLRLAGRALILKNSP